MAGMDHLVSGVFVAGKASPGDLLTAGEFRLLEKTAVIDRLSAARNMIPWRIDDLPSGDGFRLGEIPGRDSDQDEDEKQSNDPEFSGTFPIHAQTPVLVKIISSVISNIVLYSITSRVFVLDRGQAKVVEEHCRHGMAKLRTLARAVLIRNAMSFFQELKRRNVIRVGIAYAVTSWLIVQVSDVVIDNIGAPHWLFKAILLLLAIGFPLVMIFAWAFELTPEGIRKEKDVDRAQSITPTTGRKLDYAIIGLLVVALGYFIWESRFSEKGSEPFSKAAATQTVAAEKGSDPFSTIAETASEVTASPNAITEKSIAVLPFTTRSEIENDRFFSDGMHDDLLTQLAKIGDLKVISRTSVMEYRDTTRNLRQIGSELGVANIMEGAVQRSGNQVRINVQLIDAQTDEHLWAEIYDRELTTENLFAIQTEIAKAIAGALHATLSPAEQQRIEQSALTDNLEALEAYQRSRVLVQEGLDEEVLARAEKEIELALQLDPNFAAGWALQAKIQMMFHWNVRGSDERLAAALNAIEKGRAISPDLPELDIAEGYYHYWGFLDYANAIRVLEPLLLSYPNNAEVHRVLAYVYRRQGRFDEALQQLHSAFALEPRAVELTEDLSYTYQFLRNFERAREFIKVGEAIDPTSQHFYLQAGWVHYGIDGDPAAAVRSWDHLKTTMRFEIWRAKAAMGNFDLSQDFELFRDAFALGDIRLLPELMRGLSLRLSSDPAAAAPWLDQAIVRYPEMLVENPNDFRFLKPLCLAAGARNAAEKAAQVCHQALANLPDDQFDRNFHRQDIAGGFAMAGLNAEALDLIESVLSERGGPSHVELQLDPMLRSLHDEPRWQKLMAEPGATKTQR
jgi:TolB-like protein